MKRYVISIPLALILIWAIWQVDRFEASPDLGKLTEIKAQNDSLLQLNFELSKERIEVKLQSDSLNELIHQDQLTIDQLTKRKHEEIRAIDHYDHDELYRFFSNYQLKAADSSE